MLMKWEQRKFKKQFVNAKRQARIAADELYVEEIFPDFNKKVHDELKAIILPDDFDISEYKKCLSKIGTVMTKAADSFDWDSPLLDTVPEVV